MLVIDYHTPEAGMLCTSAEEVEKAKRLAPKHGVYMLELVAPRSEFTELLRYFSQYAVKTEEYLERKGIPQVYVVGAMLSNNKTRNLRGRKSQRIAHATEAQTGMALHEIPLHTYSVTGSTKGGWETICMCVSPRVVEAYSGLSTGCQPLYASEINNLLASTGANPRKIMNAMLYSPAVPGALKRLHVVDVVAGKMLDTCVPVSARGRNEALGFCAALVECVVNDAVDVNKDRVALQNAMTRAKEVAYA